MAIYGTMQGPNEFLYTGNLKDWNRIPDMHRITAPALITVGKYDELTPACALRMKHALPDAELVVFPNSSHTPFYEEPDAYYRGPARLPGPPSLRVSRTDRTTGGRHAPLPLRPPPPPAAAAGAVRHQHRHLRPDPRHPGRPGARPSSAPRRRPR